MVFPLKENAAWSLLVPTSMGLRLQPSQTGPVESSETFRLSVSSAETNAASICSYLGLPVKVLTAFVKDSPMAERIRRDLRSRNMTVEGMELEQGGPWGLRHQFNIADGGFGLRGPRVHNDRAGEVGRLLRSDCFDLDAVFSDQGVRMIHLSGLIAALSGETGQFCLDIVEKAKQNGSLVSFDLNYRHSFWEGREKELSRIFRKIAEQTDILMGNEEDFQLCLGINGPDSGGRNINGEIPRFQEMMEEAEQIYPGVSVFATTLRQVLDSQHHLWGALTLDREGWQLIEPREISVLDRIGGGDAFVGGLLYGILNRWNSKQCIRFAWGAGALAAGSINDFGSPADEAQIWSIWEGNARVRR